MGKELYTNIPRKVKDLMTDVKIGRIGLPDLQRPFVWKDVKVRDLLDSMMKGYPIGYIMLWESPAASINANHIGKTEKTYAVPDDLVIDGQQRLTALLAAMHGVAIKDKNYKERHITISYNPQKKEFAVWTYAYDANLEWISDISEVFAADENHTISKLRKGYIKSVNEARNKNGQPELNDEAEDLIEDNINALLDLNIYTLPTLRISNEASEEDVADIFVRVNSGGQKLTEKNFIQTLLAVYDNDIHSKIDKFCADSRKPADNTSYNQILTVDPEHLIRVSVGIGFKRAKLSYAYMLMRGKDLDTQIVSPETRANNLQIFRESLDRVTNLNNWHAYMNLFAEAGYLKSNFISSKNAIVYGYVFYLIGKFEYKVPEVQLKKIIKKWIFTSTITGFYTGSPETDVEKQFADLRAVKTAADYVNYFDKLIATRFTDDYFRITLPGEFNNSAAISPSWYGYIASLNVLGTPTLFGTAPLSHYMTLGTHGTKHSIDKHHIFPKHYLTEIGYTTDRDRNQIANFTYLDYTTNIDISDKEPQKYVAEFRAKLGEEKYRLTCEQNALPINFENMEYMDFLAQRRVLMAQIVKKAYLELCK